MNIFKKIPSLFIAALIVVSFSFGGLLLQPQTAEAQFGDITNSLIEGAGAGIASCVANFMAAQAVTALAGGLVSGLAQSAVMVPVVAQGVEGQVIGNTATRTVKDDCLDGIAYFTAKNVLETLSQNTVSWIQGGFNEFGEGGGNAGFVQDFRARFAQVADREFNQYLRDAVTGRNADFNQVCDVFAGRVLRQVNINYYANYTDSGLEDGDLTEPTLEGVGRDCFAGLGLEEGEIDALLSGEEQEFTQSSWNALYRMVDSPDGSPISALINQNQALNNAISEANETDITQIESSGGYLSYKKCPTGFSEGGGGLCVNGDETRQPITVTPGSAIEDMLAENINSDVRRLELADEFNEIIGALGDLLISKLTGGPEGLAGVDTNSIRTFGDPDSEGGLGNFPGRDPGGYLQTEIENQLALERELLEKVDSLGGAQEIDALIDGVNQCIEDGTLSTEDEEILTLLMELEALRDTLLGIDQDQEEEIELGPQKVNWVGNDFHWELGEIYGDPECEEDGDMGNISYVHEPNTEEWHVWICRKRFYTAEDVEITEFKFLANNETNPDWQPAIEELIHEDGYRPPQNNVKVDWDGIPLNWDYYDVFNDISYILHTFRTTIDAGSNLDTWLLTFESIDANKQDMNRYETTLCDQHNRNIGARSWIVKPGEDQWTEQVCEERDGYLGFYDTGETRDALKEPDDAATNLTEYRGEITAVITELEDILADLLVDPENPDIYEQEIIDYLVLQPQFHTQDELNRAESIAENFIDVYNELQSKAEERGCELPDDFSPPPGDDGGGDSGGDGGGGGGGDAPGSDAVITNFTAEFSDAEEEPDIINAVWSTENVGSAFCQATSNPTTDFWTGNVPANGSTAVRGATEDAYFLTLSCETTSRTVCVARDGAETACPQ